MSIQIFRTKQIVSHKDASKGLRRCLSQWDLAFLGVGAIIGTGIFVLTGIAAATQAGPAIVLSFIIAGFACAFAALSYAELAAAVGGCGSAYGYSYAAFGELIAFIIGWDLYLNMGSQSQPLLMAGQGILIMRLLRLAYLCQNRSLKLQYWEA